MKKIFVYTLLGFLCVLYLVTGMSFVITEHDKTEVPTYVLDKDEKVLLEEYLIRKPINMTYVRDVIHIPPHFTQDQVQQVEKVKSIAKSDYGKNVVKHADKASKKYGVNRDLILAVILTESGFDQYAKNGNSHGLMQLSENTTASKMCSNLYNVECNIDASTKHLAGLQAKYRQDDRLALAAYNAGGGSVDSALRRTGDIPVSTRDYINKVNKYKQVIKVVVN